MYKLPSYFFSDCFGDFFMKGIKQSYNVALKFLPILRLQKKKIKKRSKIRFFQLSYSDVFFYVAMIIIAKWTHTSTFSTAQRIPLLTSTK